MFTFIFFPIFVAFVWLNAIIATEIWKRRHAPGTQIQSKPKKADNDTSTMEMKATDETNTSSNVRNISKVSTGEARNAASVFTVVQPNIDPRRNENQRQRRQMRMFKVILVLMFAFIACRLPNWIFLLYKLGNRVAGNLNLRLMYGFGLMGLLNCMLNPLLYTFLSETIRVTVRVRRAFYEICKFCRPNRPSAASHYANNQTLFAENGRRKSDGGIYLGA
jgi:7 transmembrane receptor (rhodopsin family)